MPAKKTPAKKAAPKKSTVTTHDAVVGRIDPPASAPAPVDDEKFPWDPDYVATGDDAEHQQAPAHDTEADTWDEGPAAHRAAPVDEATHDGDNDDGDNNDNENDEAPYADDDGDDEDDAPYADDERDDAADTPDATTAPDGELPLDDARRPAPTHLVFTSGDERRMTSLALSAYAADLKALAKKASDMGRQRDANGMLRDASLVRESLMVQLDAQATLPLGNEGTVRDALMHTVGARVRGQLSRALSETECKTFEKLFGKLADLTTDALLPILHEVSSRAFEAGERARDLSPESVMRQAIYTASSQANAERGE